MKRVIIGWLLLRAGERFFGEKFRVKKKNMVFEGLE